MLIVGQQYSCGFVSVLGVMDAGGGSDLQEEGSCLWWSPTAVLHCLASRRYGCPLCPIICCSHEGGLGALAPSWAVCFLQPKQLPVGRVPFPVTVLSLEN